MPSHPTSVMLRTRRVCLSLRCLRRARNWAFYTAVRSVGWKRCISRSHNSGQSHSGRGERPIFANVTPLRCGLAWRQGSTGSHAVNAANSSTWYMRSSSHSASNTSSLSRRCWAGGPGRTRSNFTRCFVIVLEPLDVVGTSPCPMVGALSQAHTAVHGRSQPCSTVVWDVSIL